MTSKKTLACRWLVVAGAALATATWIWLSDNITLQGERTIYTAACAGGEWRGMDCAGRLVAGDRYRFRALRAHREVLFWRVGGTEASGKMVECAIDDGRNWKCPFGTDSPRSIALQMDRGRAVHDPTHSTQEFRAVEKWRWVVLSLGVSAGTAADY